MFRDSGATTKYSKWHFTAGKSVDCPSWGLLTLAGNPVVCAVKHRFSHPESGKVSQNPVAVFSGFPSLKSAGEQYLRMAIVLGAPSQVDHLKMAHNRFSGPVPRMNEVGKSKWTLLWAEFDFNHNFFDGTIGDQWDRLLSKSRDVTFKFRDNRLRA